MGVQYAMQTLARKNVYEDTSETTWEKSISVITVSLNTIERTTCMLI
jgi:hypothetical protein